MKMGFGVHDSSAALIPYLKAQKNPFLLISTGTWSISINPFNKEKLRKKLKKSPKKYFKLESIASYSNEVSKTDLANFSTFKKAYHQLMIELMELHIILGNIKLEQPNLHSALL